MALISSNTAASTRLHQRGGFWAQQLWELRPFMLRQDGVLR